MSHNRPTRRSVSPSLKLIQLEDRSVPAAFTTGSIQGQNGWDGGALPIDSAVTQQVNVAGTGHTGAGSFVVSNSTVNGDYTSGFAGWPFSPALSVQAGQPSSGAAADVFSATVWFRSVSSTADGSNIEIDLGFADGSDRNSYLAVQNKADADGGLQIETTEPAGTSGSFFAPTTQISNLARGVWHRLDIVATFRDGSANDNYQLFVNGALINNVDTGGTTFDTFEGYYEGVGAAYKPTNRLLFRSSLKASELGAFADNAPQGFAFDDVTTSVSSSSAPSTPLAYYFAGFESRPSVVYVNSTFVGLPGTPVADADPNTPGNQPAMIGVDAFADLGSGLANVADGGQVVAFDNASTGGALTAGTRLVVGGVNGTAALTTGPMQLANSSILAMEINGTAAGTQYDQLVGTASIDIGGAQLELTTRNAPTPSARYTLVQAAGGISGQFANLPEGAVVNYGGFNYRIRYTANEVFLELDRADLSVTITDNVASVQFGGIVTYTITVRNNGPRTATGAQLDVQLPPGLIGATYTSSATGGATGHSLSGGGPPQDLLTLPSGAVVTYTLTAQVLGGAGQPMLALANIVVPTLSLFDANLANNSAADGTFVVAPDTTRPTAVVLMPVSMTVGVQAGLMITFNELVSGFTASEVNLVNATLFGFLNLGNGQYAVTIIPTAPGPVGVSIPDFAAVDASGNPSIAAAAAGIASAPITPTPTLQPRYATVVGGTVTVHNPTNGTTTQFTPYPGFAGGVTVATGDLNGDGIPELVTGAGAGGGPHVKVFDGATGQETGSFYAYDPSFSGGVFVAVGGGKIVTGAGAGGGPHVKAFTATGGELASFYAYDPSFSGGVRVAVADQNGDGIADIVTGAGAGGGPHVKVFDGGTMAETVSFYAFDPSFSGGVYVAASAGQIVVGTGDGIADVKTFDGRTGAQLSTFLPYAGNSTGPLFRGGVRVAVADLNGDSLPDLITGAGPGGNPHVKVFTMPGYVEVASFYASPLLSSGVFVG